MLIQHRRLLLFPLVGLVFWLGIAAFFFVPPAFAPTGYPLFSHAHWSAVFHEFFTGTANVVRGHSDENYHLSPFGMAYGAVFYLAAMFGATFVNVAFYHEILSALRGGDVQVRRGLSFAATRWRAVLCWSLLAGVVGVLIRKLEERFGFVGRFLIGLIGMAWSVAAVFAIPVLVTQPEIENPFTVLKRSAETLRRTWGEALIGYVGISLGNVVVLLLSMAILIPGFILGASYSPLFFIPCALWVGMMFLYGYLIGVANEVFRGALYLYATDGTVAGSFTPEMFDAAWKRKK